ncbi:MAG: class I SAM-dependent methyltransferase family protein [Asgard group archaeon]|nr:class I SAM-dependent methyltransferase family protein [Asgard group archaeon]
MVSCVAVPLQKGEQVRSYLSKNNLLNTNYSIITKNNQLIIPVTRNLTENEKEFLLTIDKNVAYLSLNDLPEEETPPGSHFDVLKDKLPADEFQLLPRSFDTIGDIIVIEIPDELWHRRKLIGEALLTAHSSITTVYAKAGKVAGVNRIRPVEYLAGKKKTKTIHKEHGIRYSVDITKAYFSPRLSEEHTRIADQVQPQEEIIDMFCGIGPFAIPIASKVEAKIHAIDINKDAIQLLKESMELNKLKGKIIPYVGDCRKVIKNENLKGIADRIIMNLPGYAVNYLDSACQALKPEGGIIHFFEFVGGDNPEKQIVKDLRKEVTKSGRKVKEILEIRRVRMSAPRQWQMVVDALIE